ncbi:MAG: hypothetical protein JJ895_03665 [Balneolaceae bacterium]|nr:hypothetical protein [Balneolaceae bacterium]
MKKLLLPIVIYCLSGATQAQTSISYETQPFLTGLTHGLRLDYSMNEDLNLFIRGGVNYTNRWDWGKKDEEIGSGSGLGLGYELKNNRVENLTLIVRADFWFMEIEWTQYITSEEIDRICRNIPPGLCDPAFSRSGITKTNVFQPTIGIAYKLPIVGAFFVNTSINLGREFNFNTRGEQVHQGAILLGGIQVGYEF